MRRPLAGLAWRRHGGRSASPVSFGTSSRRICGRTGRMRLPGVAFSRALCTRSTRRGRPTPPGTNSMIVPVFVDTNVLVYARDPSAAEKHPRAREWVTHLWRTASGRVSFQVLNEYYAVVTRKL